MNTLPEEHELLKIQIWVEWCMERFLSKTEIYEKIIQEGNVDENLVDIVWSTLEEQNKEIFDSYFIHGKIREQLILYQHLNKLIGINPSK